MKKMMNNKVSSVGLILSAFILIFSSCHKDKYSPIPATTQQRGILISFSDGSNKNPLESNEFVAGISAFGNESQTQLPCTVKRINGKPYLSLIADLPDEKNMKYSEDQRQATAMTEITLKVNKQKINLKCFFQYRDDSKPPCLQPARHPSSSKALRWTGKPLNGTAERSLTGTWYSRYRLTRKGNCIEQSSHTAYSYNPPFI